MRALNSSRTGSTLPRLPTAQQVATTLVESAQFATDKVTSRSAGAVRVAEELYISLSRWIGRDGCHALFVRARAQTLRSHPPLLFMELRAGAGPYVENVAETIAEFGEPATAAAIEELLAATIALLSRLVGDEIARNLIERSLPGNERGQGGSDDRRIEA